MAWGRDTVNLEVNASAQPVPVRINFGPSIKDGPQTDSEARDVESRVLPPPQ